MASNAPTVTPEEIARPEHHLRNLLAVIHRDGGHHAGRHGLQASSEAAEAEVLRLRADNERLRWKGALLVEAIRAIKPDDEWCIWLRDAVRALAVVVIPPALASPSPHTEEPRDEPGRCTGTLACNVHGGWCPSKPPEPAQQPKATHEFDSCRALPGSCIIKSPLVCHYGEWPGCGLLPSDPIHAHTEEPRT